MQLSSVYGQLENYPNALAIMQLAYSAGLVTEDRRSAGSPICCCSTTFRIAARRCSKPRSRRRPSTRDDKLYEKLANCWIAAARVREVDPAAGARGRVSPRRATCTCGSARCTCSARTGPRPGGARARHRQGPAQGPRQRAAAAGHRALQPEEVRGGAALVRARVAVGEAPRRCARLSPADPGAGLIAIHFLRNFA